jgi:hypothetical protein
LPRVTVRELGLAEMLKSGGPGTIRVTVAECDRVLLAPVIVRVYVPAGVVDAVETVIVELPELATDVGLKAHEGRSARQISVDLDVHVWPLVAHHQLAIGAVIVQGRRSRAGTHVDGVQHGPRRGEFLDCALVLLGDPYVSRSLDRDRARIGEAPIRLPHPSGGVAPHQIVGMVADINERAGISDSRDHVGKSLSRVRTCRPRQISGPGTPVVPAYITVAAEAGVELQRGEKIGGIAADRPIWVSP